MGKTALVALLGMLSMQFIGISETYPGTWIGGFIEVDTDYDFGRDGWSPKYQRFILFALEACGDTIISLHVDEDTYVIICPGFMNNTYVLIVPSSDCDAQGSCNPTNYFPFQLACGGFQTLWITWDMDGNVAFGSGAELNVNTIFTVEGEGLTEEANYLTVTTLHQDGVTMYIWKDNAPIFVDPAPDGTTSITLEETSSSDSLVYNITTTDPEGDSVEAIVCDLTDLFVFNGTELYTLQALDYEASCIYVLTICIYDKNPNNVVNTSLTIRLQNVHDEAPSVDSVSVSLPEEIGVGSYIDGGFTVSDLDEGDQLNYSLSGNDSIYFEITPDGRLKIVERIDYDPPNNIHLLDDVTLTVTDLGSNSNSTKLTFNVKDINDNSPVWDNNVVYVNVTENTAADISLCSLVAIDDDFGTNGNVSFKIVAGDDPTPRFVVEGAELKTSQTPLDYELLEGSEFKYTLTLQATDQPLTGPARSAFATFIVNVEPENEFSPVFIAPTIPGRKLSELTLPGTHVETFTASDADLGADGNVAYSIANITTTGAGDGRSVMSMFYLEEISGRLLVGDKLDFDLGISSYEITVLATDKGLPQNRSTEMVYTITLENANDNPPIIYHEDIIDVMENTAIGDVIMTFSTHDDDGDTVTATIVEGEKTMFSIVSDSEIVLLHGLDYESSAGYVITVSFTDEIHVVNATVTVRVVDVIDEVPNLEVFSPLYVTEELPVGAAVDGLYHVTDIDREDELTFTLTGADSSFFDINQTTGQITISKRIDFDYPDRVTTLDQLTLTVSDKAGLKATESLHVEIKDINDAYPQFSQTVYRVNISENSSTEMLLSLTCTDADVGPSGDVEMHILDCDYPRSCKYYLTGTELYALGADLDYEALESTENILAITAVDSPVMETPKTGVAVVVVSILPVNEQSPVFTNPLVNISGYFPDVTTPEGTPVDSVLLSINATDSDRGRDGEVTYFITSVTSDSGSNSSGVFTIDSSSGELGVSDLLDADEITGGVTFYIVNITATDSGLPPLSTYGVLLVHVTGRNDNPPVWLTTSDEIVVSESDAVWKEVLFLNASDVDGDLVTFNTSDSMFKTDGASLKLSKPLDNSLDDRRTILLSATDGEFTVYKPLTVVFHRSKGPLITGDTTISVPEELPVGTELPRRYSVFYPDDVKTLTYSLVGNATDYISIDSNSGTLILTERLDRDHASGVTSLDDLTLTVTDMSGQNASVDLNITVFDINDNPPVCDVTDDIIMISENTPTNVLVANISCKDSDSESEGAVDVSLISSTDPGQHFRVSGHQLFTGQQALDFENSSDSFVIQILAVDNPGGDVRLSSTLSVFIKVLPVNEFDPEWKGVDALGGFPDVSIPENVISGHKITTVSATDQDRGEDGHVTYSIDSIMTDSGAGADNAFNINPITGELTTSSQLDSDPSTGGVNWYTITVSASDSSTSSRSISAVQKVLLENYNDLAPVFSKTVFRVDVSCGTPGASVLLFLSAEDEDSASVEYSLLSGANPFFRVDVTGDVILQSYPDSSDVTDLVQSVVVEATDKGSPELTGSSTLLVLFEKCLTSTGSPTSTTEPCQCNETKVDTTTSPPITTERTTFEDCRQFLNMSTLNITAATAVTMPPANCTVSGPTVEEFVEAWAMRGLVMLLSAVLLGAAVMYLRPKVPSTDKILPTMEARHKPLCRKTTVLSFNDI